METNRFKRLEIYVGWTCNQKCTYCKEFPNMEESWNVKVTKYDILKKLLKYKKLGYNHVTYLGGEPLIQPVFFDALKIGKKLGYTILVTTNATTLHIESQAKKFLPYIDQLFLSVEAIGKEQQQKISRTKNYVHWEEVFENIYSYWKGNYLKGNIVITQDNKNDLFDLVKFLLTKKVKDIAITYPDIDMRYYGKKHILEKIAPSYTELMPQIVEIVDFCRAHNMQLKLPDFPFCVFPKERLLEFIKLTDDFDFATRLKVNHREEEIHRGELDDPSFLPRERRHMAKCNKCDYIDRCWGPSKHYRELYGLSEIRPICE